MMVAENWTDIIQLDHLMSTHAHEMIRRGGNPESGKPGCIEGALGTAWMAEQYATDELNNAVTGFIFACYALRGLALNHCLTDGNKRLAWIAFVETLAALQLTVDVDESEAAAFVNDIIVDHLTSEQVIRWAEARLSVLVPPSGD